MGFFNSGKQVVIGLITPLRMSYEESYAKAVDKMIPGMLYIGHNPKSNREELEYSLF